MVSQGAIHHFTRQNYYEYGIDCIIQMYNNLRPKSRGDFSYNRPSTRHRNTKQAEKCFGIAKEHQNRKEYDSAINLYNEALKNDPDDFRSYCNLGAIYKMKGNYHEAINKYHRALLAKDNDYKTLYNLANLYRVIGHADKAIKTYMIILSASQTQNLGKQIEIDTNNNMGICYKNIGQYEHALKCYDRVIQLSGQDEVGYYNKGFCLMALVKDKSEGFEMIRDARINQAEEMFTKAYQKNNKNIMSLIQLIQVKYIKDPSEENIKKSILEYEKILTDINTNDNIKIVINRKIADCKAMFDLNKKEEIIKPPSQSEIIPVIQNQPSPAQIITTSNNQIALTDNVQNVGGNNIKQSKEINNGVNLAQLEKEKVLKQLNEKQQKKINEQKENEKRFLSGKSEMDSLIEQQNYKQAIKIAEKYRFCKIVSEYKAILYSKSAKKYFDLKFAKEAIDIFYYGILKYDNFNRSQAVLKPQCTTAQVFNAVGDALTMSGNHKLAIDFYRIASQLSSKDNNTKENVCAYGGLAYNYEKLNLNEEAQACFRKSIQVDPSIQWNYLDLADCLHQNGKYNEAVTYYNEFLKRVPKKQSRSIDNCLNNLAVCWKNLNNQEKELETLEKLMKNYDDNFNSLDELFETYQPLELVKVYMELANIYESIIAHNSNKKIFQEINNKLILVYKVMIECTPQQCFLYLDLAGCLHEGQNFQQALTYYKIFVNKANRKTHWFQINNCLSNMSVCYKQLNMQQQELLTLQTLLKRYDQHYTSLEQLFKHYEPQQLIKVYLQISSLYEKILSDNTKTQFHQKVKANILLVYQVMIQFPNCPNPQSITAKINTLKQK